jgi:hypothetical protein
MRGLWVHSFDTVDDDFRTLSEIQQQFAYHCPVTEKSNRLSFSLSFVPIYTMWCIRELHLNRPLVFDETRVEIILIDSKEKRESDRHSLPNIDIGLFVNFDHI